jgi:iron complex transport system ATP-binding protein
MKPASGEILIGGREVSRIPRMEMARIVGVVPQFPLLPSAFTAFEVVLMGRNPHLGLLQNEGKTDIAIALEAMGKTSTRHLAARRVDQLSGGEIQSIVIARVLAQKTMAMLLDEPTSNLDIGRQVEILDLIKNLCRNEGLTVVIALHELNLAAQYCDRMILLDKGAVCFQGRPQDVINAKNIARVYGPGSLVYSHPANGLPVVLPMPTGQTG